MYIYIYIPRYETRVRINTNFEKPFKNEAIADTRAKYISMRYHIISYLLLSQLLQVGTL